MVDNKQKGEQTPNDKKKAKCLKEQQRVEKLKEIDLSGYNEYKRDVAKRYRDRMREEDTETFKACNCANTQRHTEKLVESGVDVKKMYRLAKARQKGKVIGVDIDENGYAIKKGVRVRKP